MVYMCAFTPRVACEMCMHIVLFCAGTRFFRTVSSAGRDSNRCSTEAAARATVPGEYTFPTPPLDLQEQLKGLRAGDLTDQLRAKIVRWLHMDICRYSLYPGRRNLYHEAARLLVFFYPALRDINGPGFNSWWRQLKNRTKNQRKSLTEIQAVQATRAKYGKRKRQEQSPSPSRGCVRQTVAGHLEGQSEDGETVSAHRLFMVREMKRNAEDRHLDRVTDAMARTHAVRRRLIEQEDGEAPQCLTVAEILAEYPALALEHEIYNEFHRLTRCHVETGLNTFVERYGKAVIDVASRRKYALKCLAGFPPHLRSAVDEGPFGL
ncbi:uncharacterized protein LOC135393165 [Ornithodoros turicata]|uniref:uncharacterized protein LOC135393165 n=1 Tax=Ornithodoros turicata TaxID=34597 RepID=UPI00313952D2